MSPPILNSIRPAIRALVPYQSARMMHGGEGMILLDANENPDAPFGAADEALPVNRYPAGQPARLHRRMADLYGVEPETLLITRGADEGIDLVIRAFCEAGQDSILITPPTFGYFAVAARIQGADVTEAPMEGEDFTLNEKALRKALQETNPKILFLCSPNNPTGTEIDSDTVQALAAEFSEVLIVVDEAYIEFSDRESLTGRAGEISNLMVLRTLSKAHGLAGARLGAAIGHADIIRTMRAVQTPYPIPQPVVGLALEALSAEGLALAESRLSRIRAERKRMAAALAGHKDIERVMEGPVNFLLLKVRGRDAMMKRLLRSGILARAMGRPLQDCIRITIGTRAENDAVLAALRLAEPHEKARTAEVERITGETRIWARIDLDGPAGAKVETGLGFLDHMLAQIATHGGIALEMKASGDTEVDAHHLIEDCMLALGEGIDKALGARKGLGRFGFVLPMDETRAEVSIDLSGRPYAKFAGAFDASHIGDFPTEMVAHAFRSLAHSMRAAVHVKVDGENDHHRAESGFKAFGRALRMALQKTGEGTPSSKGRL